ncbi:MAG: twin-arginine translocation signal domain-containing protein, partial [Desulfobacterales bacterium]
MNKKVEFNPNMNRRDFLTGATAFIGSMLLAPNFAFAAPKKPKEIIVRAWGGAWGDALKAGVADGFSAATGI